MPVIYSGIYLAANWGLVIHCVTRKRQKNLLRTTIAGNRIEEGRGWVTSSPINQPLGRIGRGNRGKPNQPFTSKGEKGNWEETPNLTWEHANILKINGENWRSNLLMLRSYSWPTKWKKKRAGKGVVEIALILKPWSPEIVQ